MARTIESPGVEIREIDLSNISTLPIGTNILLQGFAAQGPTDELLNITSKTELEQIYGEPTNAAERYFIQSAKEVLNSPGRLLVNRLPYGEGEGYGATSTRSALLFPFVPALDTSVVGVTGAVLQQDSFEIGNGFDSFTLTKPYSSGLQLTVKEEVATQGDDKNTIVTHYVVNDINTIKIFDADGNDLSFFASTLNQNAEYTEIILTSELDLQTEGISVQYNLSGSEFTQPDILNSTDLIRPLDATIAGATGSYYWPEDQTEQGITYDGSNISLKPGSLAATTYLKGFVLGAPVMLSNLTEEQVEAILDGQYYGQSSKLYSRGDSQELASFTLSEGNYDEAIFDELYNLGKSSGLVVINSNFANVESNYSGYYLGVNDNYKIADDTFDKIKYVYTRDGSGDFEKISALSTSTNVIDLKTPLSGTLTSDSGSVSEIIEIGPAFSTAFAAVSGTQYKHMLEFSLWKVYESTEETQGNNKVLRTYYSVAPFVGSFVKDFKDSLNNPYGGQSAQSHFVEDIYKTVGATPWLDIRVSPVIKENMTEDKFVRMFTTSNDFANDPVVISSGLTEQSIQDIQGELDLVFTKSVDGLFSIGPYAPTKGGANDSGKQIGDVVKKLERGLALAENVDLIPLELVLDAGLSTINAVVKTDADAIERGIYDDAINFAAGGSEKKGHIEWLTVFNVLNNFCQQTRKDCMCIVDPLRHIFVQNTDDKVLSGKTKTFSQHILTPLRDLVNACNSSYAATYANWVKVYDTGSGSFFWAPFSAYEASIMARMDALLQPWFAPAGLNNGIVRNVVDLAITPTQRERDLLYRFGLNPITSFPRDGFVVYGQKTLQAKPSAFDRINVRRLFLFLEKATRQIAKYFVFEPNTVFTRTRLVNVLTPIFELAKNNQGVYDYLIVCDERNNLPDVIDRNELVVDIYIKPVRTAEFILINFIATRTGANFEEIISGTGA